MSLDGVMMIAGGVYAAVGEQPPRWRPLPWSSLRFVDTTAGEGPRENA